MSQALLDGEQTIQNPNGSDCLPFKDPQESQLKQNRNPTRLELDKEQDLDTRNTTTQRGTKLLKSKLNRKIVGAPKGYRIVETTFWAFWGL